jgi:hypothetical protein
VIIQVLWTSTMREKWGFFFHLSVCPGVRIGISLIVQRLIYFVCNH